MSWIVSCGESLGGIDILIIMASEVGGLLQKKAGTAISRLRFPVPVEG